ncbi:MAG: amidohydrolase [Comamonadaceae bacterium]|nr:MAG: amidohydrolase [Comamonadaceae bacterium]
MCRLCVEAAADGRPAPLGHASDPPARSDGGPARWDLPRRGFFKVAAATAAGAVAGAGLTAVGGSNASEASGYHGGSGAPGPRTGEEGVRTLLSGATLLTMDATVGNFAQGDVLIEGKRILQVGTNLSGAARSIDLRGKIVMPGFIDTHHHQFETALRGLLADSILRPDGTPQSELNYFDTVINRFTPVYRPEDVYINELFAGLSQLDAGVTTVLDISQIHNSPEHSDAAVRALKDTGRRAVFGYFEGSGAGARYPEDARRLRRQWFSSDDQLVTMAMGGELYLPVRESAWAIGRDLGLQIVNHVTGTSRAAMEALGQAGQIRNDNLFIHMTGMSDAVWRFVADAGAAVTLAPPIEMTMRHGTPPIQKAIDFGVAASLSSDVECTMTADMFTIMRSAFTLQRMLANEKTLAGLPAPALLKSRDVLRMATIDGARGLRLDRKVGSITPGKEADLVVLDAQALNVAPLNHAAGAVVTLMDRSNVFGVLVAGKVRKWDGRLLNVDLDRLRRELEQSRDRLFAAVNQPRNVLQGA